MMRTAAKLFLTALAAVMISPRPAAAARYDAIPSSWKWVSSTEAVFSYDGSFTDERCFSVRLPSFSRSEGVKAPGKFSDFPFHPEGAVNMRYSPDSLHVAFTRDNDLYVMDALTGWETRLTDDGSDLILNGYASWVYYEEIFGRSSRYCAFWWSPDSKKIAFYRFDNGSVPMFPIYSPAGKHGSLKATRYPQAGDTNPSVRVGIVDIGRPSQIVWAGFPDSSEQYFGIPFWGDDSARLFVPREPRLQNTLDLYAVDSSDGSPVSVYHETCDTWLNWMEEVLFTPSGLFMARDFETDYQQIYFLSYDGRTLKKLSDGPNRDIHLIRADRNTVIFTSKRDFSYKNCLYSLDIRDGSISSLTPPGMNATDVEFAPDGRHFAVRLSNWTTPDQVWIFETATAHLAWMARSHAASASKGGPRYNDLRAARTCTKVADMAGEDFRAEDHCLPRILWINASDGQQIPASIVYPEGFDPSRRYPVVMEIYGGPQTMYVRERWSDPEKAHWAWFARNGFITVVADSRAAGHTWKKGTDLVYCDLTGVPVEDFVTWAEYLGSLPYVDGSRIGVEGFSFGGTMTAMLLLKHPDVFRCGIAGGGVYDWSMYDSHYTERFMKTPSENPDGYKASSVLEAVPEASGVRDGALKLTHGTGDDNVHFQNTLRLADALQQRGIQFEMMIYPDGMHGYRGAQAVHSDEADRIFWLKHLSESE